MAASKQASKQANIHTHVCNAVPLVWGSLRLAPITVLPGIVHRLRQTMKTPVCETDRKATKIGGWFYFILKISVNKLNWIIHSIRISEVDGNDTTTISHHPYILCHFANYALCLLVVVAEESSG